jgi:hypothetical protein
MILVGLTMTMRSQGDQITASQQKATDQALAAAEKGVAYYQQVLNTYRSLALYPDCAATVRTNENEACGDPNPPTGTISITQMSWSNASKINNINTSCDASMNPTDIETRVASTIWKDVDSTSDTIRAQFRLVNYQYNGSRGIAYISPSTTELGTGQLTVEGQMIDTSTSPFRVISRTRLQIDIPVKQSPPGNISVPGVWVGASATEDGNGTGNNRIRGNVLIGCDIAESNINIVGNHRAIRTRARMPNVLTRPTTGVIPLNTINSSTSGAQQVSGRTVLTLPRTGITPADATTTFNGQPTFVYSVDTIAQNTDLKITPGRRVVIFLTGSIAENNVTIEHNCSLAPSGTTCRPTNFQIYGEATSGNPQICLNGGAYMDAFILAPQYMVGVAGAGNGGGIRGTVWAKIWGNNAADGGNTCGSEASNVVVEQTEIWEELGSSLLPEFMKPTLDPISSWQRQPVN